jgi:hypothetical protein
MSPFELVVGLIEDPEARNFKREIVIWPNLSNVGWHLSNRHSEERGIPRVAVLRSGEAHTGFARGSFRFASG